MKITPLDIRQKSFEKAFRGYDKGEVEAFLTSLSHEWERLLQEREQQMKQIGQLEKEVDKLREVENSLYKALKTAEDTGNNMIEQANKSAELHLQETRLNAENLKQEAQEGARKIVEAAEQRKRHILDQMEQELQHLRQTCRQLENFKGSLISEVRSAAQEVEARMTRLEDRGHHIDAIMKEADQFAAEAHVEAVASSAFNNGPQNDAAAPETAPAAAPEASNAPAPASTDQPKTKPAASPAEEEEDSNAASGSFFDSI